MLYICRLEKQITSFLEDRDPESRLEVGADMRKIHHCFHHLKVGRSLPPGRSLHLLCSDYSAAFLLTSSERARSHPHSQMDDLRTKAVVVTELLQSLSLTCEGTSSDHRLLILSPGIPTFTTE